jgi:hypothetical protein
MWQMQPLPALVVLDVEVEPQPVATLENVKEDVPSFWQRQGAEIVNSPAHAPYHIDRAVPPRWFVPVEWPGILLIGVAGQNVSQPAPHKLTSQKHLSAF